MGREAKVNDCGRVCGHELSVEGQERWNLYDMQGGGWKGKGGRRRNRGAFMMDEKLTDRRIVVWIFALRDTTVVHTHSSF